MALESYAIAKDVLKRIKGPVEVQVYPSLSKTTVAACTNAAQSLRHLKLSSEEKGILEQVQDFTTVESLIEHYVQEIGKRKNHSKMWRKVYAFTQFAGPVLEIFKQANLSPECSIALGLVGLLLIQPFNNKSEIEERLETEIGQLKDIISQVKFSTSVVPTPEMGAEIEGLSAAITDFLNHALQYQKKWCIVKVLGSILPDFAQRFQSFVDKIRKHAAKIEQLAQRGYTMVLLDSRETLDNTARTIQELHIRIGSQAALFDIKLARLEDNLALCRGHIADHTRFETIRYTQQISTILFPDLIDLESEKAFIRQQENALAPKERWENHTSEIQFPGWVKRDPRPILWIGGRQNRRDVSWVSSFALDVIEALEIERSADVASVLCNKGSNLEQPTPLFIFKRMIIQLLQGHPDIVSMPKNLILLPLQRFEQIEKSPEAAYKVLADVLRMIDERNNVESREIFLVIDRIDICLGRENEQGRKRLFRSLQMLSLEYKSVQLILTSQYPAKDMGVLLEGEKHLAEVWMNTTKH